MFFNWETLAGMGDNCFLRALVKGGVGKMHCVSLADRALQNAMGAEHTSPGTRGIWLELGRALLCASWDADPLDGVTASQLLALDAIQPFLEPPVRQAAQEVCTGWRVPEEQRYYAHLVQKRDIPRMQRYLEQQAEREPLNTYWIQQLLAIAIYEGDTSRAADIVTHTRSVPHAVRQRVLADVCFLQEDYERAAGYYAAVWPEGTGGVVEHLVRGAEALCRGGGNEPAASLWQAALRVRGWDANLVLRVHDAMTGLASERHPPEGQGAVLLYTWNKAESLDVTLKSLAASELGDTLVVVLDNGSTDGTPQVLARWKTILGERMRTVTLPCNVGAPAARNWLMHMSDLDHCRWVAYCDDDVELPMDWLGYFGAAMQQYPRAAVWGCRVVDFANPMRMQAVDMHLDVGSEQAPEQAAWDGERRFAISTLHHQDMDFGQFCYMRPCATVTGCCHMFLLAALRKGGGFDLRFSPSQYDDVEHDLRHVLQGNLPVYQGHLGVRHMKRSGKASLLNTSEHGSAVANMYKLQQRYSKEEFDCMRAHVTDACLQDLKAKAAHLVTLRQE